MDKRYQVFVSSTYFDLKKERQEVIQVLMEMDCIPAGMELFPAADEEQLAFIKRIIDDCDYYILIIGGRYGSVTPEGISYTELEYDYAISRGLKVVALIHNSPDDIPVGKSDIKPELRKKLDEFRARVSENRLVKFWSDAKDLPGLVALSLQKTIKTYPAVGWVRASSVASDELLLEINELRKENSQLHESIANLETQYVPEESDLAGLDDSYTVTLIWRNYDEYGELNEVEDKFTATWVEYFSRIAPELLARPSDDEVRDRLAKSLYRNLNIRNSIAVDIARDDFQTIRIQLSALGLVDVANLEGIKVGGGLFWSLTKRGQRMMTKLLTVKAAAKDTTDK